MKSNSALIVAGVALLVIAPVQWMLFPEYRFGVLSVRDAIVIGVIGGVGLILLAIGLIKRFLRAAQPVSASGAVDEKTHPVIGYTPDGQPVTSSHIVGYQPVRPTNTMAVVTIIVSLLFSLLAIPFGHIALAQIKRTGEQGKVLAIVGLVIGYMSLVALLIAATILIIGASRGW